MKIFLGFFIALLLVGTVAYHVVEERKVQAANNLCADALVTLAQPAAQRAPHFVKLDVAAALSNVAGNGDYVVRADARVVTLQNAAPNLAGPDYSLGCRVKDGALADAIWLRRP